MVVHQYGLTDKDTQSVWRIKGYCNGGGGGFRCMCMELAPTEGGGGGGQEWLAAPFTHPSFIDNQLCN